MNRTAYVLNFEVRLKSFMHINVQFWQRVDHWQTADRFGRHASLNIDTRCNSFYIKIFRSRFLFTFLKGQFIMRADIGFAIVKWIVGLWFCFFVL